MAYKLDIFNVLRAVDRKDYGFYDSLTDDEKKGFSAVVTMKWLASVGTTGLQYFYLASTNCCANKYLFDINKHPKLQYLSMVASSPGKGSRKHVWISSKKKKINKNIKDIQYELRSIYPEYKEEDIELLSILVTKKELKQYARDSGK